MFKDKNFGLPKDLIESARSVMEKKDPIGDKIKELDKGHSGWETRGVSADGGKGFLKIPRYTATITDEGPVKRKEFDMKAYKKETEEIKRSPGKFSPNIKLGENHVVKFTSYLKENFHINELTEEEIAWIYENEYINERSGFSATGGNSTNTGSGPQVTPRETIARERKSASQQPDVFTRLGRNISDIASSAYDALPDVTDAAKRATQRDSEDAAQGNEMRDAAARAAANARAKARDEADAESGAQMRQRAATSSRPAASAARREPQESDYQAAKKAVPGDSSDPGATATERLKYMAGRGNRAARKALTGPPEDWRKSVFEPND